MNFTGQRVGIWGTGVVGTSGIRFFTAHGAQVTVYDAAVHAADRLEPFLQECTYILPSAGIDLKPYRKYAHKFLSEVDIFYHFYTKPTIAITGSVGKTTVTHAICTLLKQYGFRVRMAGNVGVALFDLLDEQQDYDYAILELSSFQLERATGCSPTVALITNLYANHLDRHGSMSEYARAKLTILRHAPTHALVHDSVRPYVSQQRVTYFTSVPAPEITALVTQQRTHIDHYTILYHVAQMLKLDLQKLPAIFNLVEPPEHRVTLIATHGGTAFYDDSKATVMEATHGALVRFVDKKVLLFIGGVSKGVSRAPFFDTVPEQVKHICFFGEEALSLARLCPPTVTHAEHADLEAAFPHPMCLIPQHDVVLLSPGGASFVLFKNYKERGKRFQELVRAYVESK